MARQEQLEIISPGGEVKFLSLDPSKGIINIGRHPENDLVLENPQIGLFHAVLDYRQKPYRIMALGTDGDLMMGSERLPANTPRPVNLWDTFQLSGYLFILYEGDGIAVNIGRGVMSVPQAATPMLPSGAKAPALPAGAKGAAAAVSGAPGAKDATQAVQSTAALPPQAAKLGKLPFGRQKTDALGASADAADENALVTQTLRTLPRLTTLPPDRDSQVIVTDMPLRDFVLDVGQTANFPLTIANGGAIVASFDISVEGLDESWLVISPKAVNLNEGERTSVSISITPPRLPNSLAGKQFFLVTVKSLNYAGEVSQKAAALTINPFYEFAVSELSPRQQTISYRQHTGQAALTVVNKGNSNVPYKLEAEDDQRACSFEFTVPGHDSSLAKQAELRLPATTAVNIPICITPNRRHIFGFRARSFSVTVTTTPLEAQQIPRSVLAQVYAAPLIGPWTVVITLMLLALLIAWIFHPTISEFKVDRTAVLAKQPVNLTWNASTFAELRIDNGVGALASHQGTIQVVPQNQVNTYHLTAENFLTKLAPQWFSASKDVTVNVVPVLPTVQLAVVMPNGQRVPAGTGSIPPILRGEAITLYWEVTEADALILTSNGAPETIQPTDYIGKRTLTPDKDTVYTLEGRNKYGPDNKSLTIKVNEPPTQTPTPTPTVPPATILRFDVAPLVITAGDSIKLDWEVMNVDHVQIQGVTGGNGTFPPKGSVEQKPDKDTVYVLIPGNGVNVRPQQRQVKVNPQPATPTPTASPIPPKVESFVALPQSVVKGSAQANAVQLTWLVIGAYTDISLSGNNFPTQSGLSPSGTITVAVSSSVNFILSVTLNKQVATQNVNVTALDPTPTPTPVPTNTPLPTATPRPPKPQITFFTLDATTNNNPPDVVLVSSSANSASYNVIAGSTVKFNWGTNNAGSATFNGGSAQIPTGSQTLPINSQPTQPYVLTALNSAGDQVQSFINVTLYPKPAPPAPTSMNGQNGPPIVATWQYPFSYNILGFRVYRGPVPYTNDSNYSKVADESTLKSNVLQWTDNTTAATNTPCNWSYYVVAVYSDGISADNKESARPAQFWYTRTCNYMTPTPKP